MHLTLSGARSVIMPRLYFHLRKGTQLVRDEEGTDFESATAAREDALRAARELIAESATKGDLPLSHVFEVVDAAGTRLFIMPFRSAVRIS